MFLYVLEDIVNEEQEHGWSVGLTKKPELVLKVAETSIEGYLPLITFPDVDKVMSIVKVYYCEYVSLVFWVKWQSQ